MHNVYVVMSILTDMSDKKLLSLDCSPDNASNTASIHLHRLNVITSSVKDALTHGPKFGCPVSYQIMYSIFIFVLYKYMP